jgi:peptidoglycan/LPS O-acetylase OafA/YrhL
VVRWAAVVVISFSSAVYFRASGASSETTGWTDIGFFFAIVAAVVGGLLSLLALGAWNRSRVAHVIAVSFYAVVSLVLVAWTFVLEPSPGFALTVHAPAASGFVLLMLPSSREWCHGQRSDALK